MEYKIIKSHDYRQMPWKNGLGLTREIFRRDLSGGEAFTWRVSMADIAEKKSPFSKFPGMTRVINTLKGNGFRLCVDGRWTEPLLKYDPFIFSGDDETESELINDPIRDFNLIYAPRFCRARLQWLDLAAPQTVCTQAGEMLIFNVEGTLVESGDFSIKLEAEESLLLLNARKRMNLIKISGRGGRENRCCLIEVDGQP